MVVEHLIDNNRIFIDLPKCQAVLLISLFIYFYPHPRTFSSLHFRERGREGETLMQERSTDWLPPIRLDRGLNLQPRYVPWRGIKPATFQPGNDALTHGATPARASFIDCKLSTILENFPITVHVKLRFTVIAAASKNSFLYLLRPYLSPWYCDFQNNQNPLGKKCWFKTVQSSPGQKHNISHYQSIQ